MRGDYERCSLCFGFHDFLRNVATVELSDRIVKDRVSDFMDQCLDLLSLRHFGLHDNAVFRRTVIALAGTVIF